MASGSDRCCRALVITLFARNGRSAVAMPVQEVLASGRSARQQVHLLTAIDAIGHLLDVTAWFHQSIAMWRFGFA
jgi:hypothetical protein